MPERMTLMGFKPFAPTALFPLLTISGGNLQNNAVSARNYLYKVKQTTLLRCRIATCSPWRHRKCSRCR